MERRKVMFTYGMSADRMIIITDAPSNVIEKWCEKYNQIIEDGGVVHDIFEKLKSCYYVKLLHDSEIDSNENVDVIGYDEAYDLNDY